jgi:hypothetical protein
MQFGVGNRFSECLHIKIHNVMSLSFTRMKSLLGFGKGFALMLSLCLILLGNGCATYYVYQGGGHQPGGPWSKPRPLNASAWGLFRGDDSLKDPHVCRLPDRTQVGFDAVKIETNVLASVLTLGIWMPAKVSYRCAQAPPPSGTSAD